MILFEIADRASNHSLDVVPLPSFSPSAICKPGLERVRKACKCSERGLSLSVEAEDKEQTTYQRVIPGKQRADI